MKRKWKRGIVIAAAAALVISAGIFSSDHFLKATDGEENIVDATVSDGDAAVTAAEDEFILPPTEEQTVLIEQGVFVSELTSGEEKAEEESAEIPEEESAEVAEEESAEVAEEESAEVTLGEGEIPLLTENSKLMEEAVLTAKKQPVQTERSVSITYEVVGGEFTGIGSQIRLSAVLSGFDEVEPTYQWQYSNGGEWVDIGGATSSDYTLTVTEDNCTYSWRVSVTG